MDSFRWCVLLALLLLEVAVCVEDGKCESGRTNCEVISINEEMVTLDCGVNHQRTNERTNRRGSNERKGRPYQKNSVSNEIKITPDKENISTVINVTDSNIHYNKSNEIFSDAFQASDSTNEKSNNTDSYSLLKDSLYNEVTSEGHLVDSVALNDSQKKYTLRSSNATGINVNLLQNSSHLDLSFFPNATTLIINASGYTCFYICGAKNVTNLSITSSKLNHTNFTRTLTELKYLNLSDNNINAIPITDLPSSISYLDLSYNNVIFNTNTSFPDALKLLNVSYNNIKSMNNIILKGNVIVLDFRGNRLTHVPVLNMKALEELYLSNNTITTLKKGAFINLDCLTVLDLRENYLSSLGDNVFEGLYRLQLLDMSRNNVIYLAPATFQYLNNLVSLSVSGNTNLGHLQDVKDASLLFGTGQRLQKIEASSTNLTRVPSTLTRSVKKIFLANNAINSILCGEMDSFPLLQVMDVSNNLITDIEEDALGRLDFLSHLLLSENKLNSIPKSLPNQLQVLDMRCNSISKLISHDFLGLQKLRVLLLSNNMLTVIEDGAFGQLSSLEVLDISYNPIKTLSRTSFIGPRKLKEMYLISLTELISFQEPLSFPAPESAHLEVLNIESSPVLATQLMDDVAALTMFHELFELNLNHCRLSTLRSDLPKYLPRLHKLELTGNILNCSNIIWLVKWLQALNISTQDKGNFRKDICKFNYICCKGVNRCETDDEANVVCASPQYLSGKQVISLEEEDLPDLKLTSSTHPTPRQVFITNPNLPQTLGSMEQRTSSGLSDMIDVPPSPTLSMYNLPSVSSKNIVSMESTATNSHYSGLPDSANNKPHQDQLKNIYFNLNSPRDKLLSNSSKYTKTINRSRQKWEYLKKETKYKLSSSEPDIVLLNETSVIESDFDNQLNESASSGAYLAHEHPSTSHPGMFVFLLVVSVILVASSAMVYSHCSQSRRGREYNHHQDIEVSSFGGNDLW